MERASAHALTEANIEVVFGVVGTARAATEAYLAKTLISSDEWCDYDEEAPDYAEA